MKNHIILAMSTLPPRFNEEEASFSATFVGGDGKEYAVNDYKGQLEVIPRLMMGMYDGSEEEFIIYILASEETRKINEKVQDSAVGYFRKRINACGELAGRTVEYKEINMDNLRMPKEAIAQAIECIRNEYAKDAEKENRLWVDTHGGLRDIAQSFSAIISLLRVYHIVPEQILGVETVTKVIYSQKEAFDVFEYVSGMNDFINFGRADVLKEYYAKSNNADIKAIIDAMDEIAFGTQLCDPGMYKKGIMDLRKSIGKMSDAPFLRIFSEYIRSDYGEDLIPSDPGKIGAEIPPLAIIERCVNKGLYQQALTFLESLMPDEFVNKRCIYYVLKSGNLGKAKEYDGKKFLSDAHYFFDTYLFKCRGLGTGYDRNENLVNAIKRISMFYLQNKGRWLSVQLSGLGQDNSLQPELTWKSSKKETGSGTSNLLVENIKVEVRANLAPIRQRQMVYLLKIHKVLKACRNLFNHSNDSRPDIQEIKNALELYIVYAKAILGE